MFCAMAYSQHQCIYARAHNTHVLQLGEIEAIRIVRNHAGKSKGFAYIEFKDQVCVFEGLPRCTSCTGVSRR